MNRPKNGSKSKLRSPVQERPAEVSSERPFDYLESFIRFHRDGVRKENRKRGTVSPERQKVREYSLERMNYLLSACGEPQKSFRSIHIAGSKGKGSTAAYTAAMLSALGFKTGVFSSPHVSSYKERFSLWGQETEDSVYAAVIRRVRDVVEGLPGGVIPAGDPPYPPLFFELVTLSGLLFFRFLRCEWAVVETGIGGRLDCTNILSPELSVITPVELEHTDILGDSLEKIAREKAGIIKKNGILLYGYQEASAEKVLVDEAAKQEARSFSLREECGQPVIQGEEIGGISFSAESRRWGRLQGETKMGGRHQAENALLAFSGIKILESAGKLFPPGSDVLSANRKNGRERNRILCDSWAEVRLPGRTEWREGNPSVLLDGAHTPKSFALLNDTVRKFFRKPPVLLIAFSATKNPRPFFPFFQNYSAVILTGLNDVRESDPREVYAKWQGEGRPESLICLPSIPEAFRTARERATGSERALVVSGSFYLVAAVRELLPPPAQV